MEARQNNEEPEINIFTDDSLSRDTSNTPSFPTIPDYNGLKQDTDVHKTLEKNLFFSNLKISKLKKQQKNPEN